MRIIQPIIALITLAAFIWLAWYSWPVERIAKTGKLPEVEQYKLASYLWRD